MQDMHAKKKWYFSALRSGLVVLAFLIIGCVAFFPSHARADTTIVTHQMVGPQVPAGQSGTLTVSCGSGEQLLSGGFSGNAFEGAVHVVENYPSAANAWTVTVNNTIAPSWVQMTISVNCLQSSSSIGTTIVHTTGSGTTVAHCQTGSVLVGGGYAGATLSPLSSPQGNGWQTNEANAYAVCATQNLTADLTESATFTTPNGFTSAGGVASCNTGELTTGGGFSLSSGSNPIISSQLGTGGWSVSAEGTQSGQTIVTVWAVCVSPSLIGSTPTPTRTLVTAIDAGGAATGSFVADTDFTQGNEYSDTSTSINTGGVSESIPQAVWQTCRWNSSFSYTIPGLTAGATYTLNLDWAELTWQSAGQRKFNVAINGSTVLSAFDVFATVGYKTALQKQFAVTANSNGQIVITFTQGGADNPFLSGIELYTT